MTIGYGSTRIVHYDHELCLLYLIHNCIYWVLRLCLSCFLRVQVFDHGELEDCDLLEQGNGTAIFPTNNSVGLEVGLHRKLVYCN